MFDIHKMTDADVSDVLPIEFACFGERWTAPIFLGELANANGHYFVARLGGEAIGFMGYWLILEEAHITTIAIHPRHRRRGYAERMLLVAIDDCMARGAKWMTLEVRKTNVAAQKLYEKYGFSSLGARKHYYQDNNEDAVIMWTDNLWGDTSRQRIAALRVGLGSVVSGH